MSRSQLFTLAEVARLLEIDRRRLDRLAKLGVVQPLYKPDRAGDSTLYHLADVALLAVLLRLEAEGVSYAGRCVFAAKWGSAVRAALIQGSPLQVVSDGLGPRVLDGRVVGTVAFRFSIGPIAARIEEEATVLRALRFGEVWAGWRSVPVEDVAVELSLA